jgi:hypothetical protein
MTRAGATRLAVALLACLALASCSWWPGGESSQGEDLPEIIEGDAVKDAPERITIVPDDYHVPYAGTAEDGRQFFLSDELFDAGTELSPGGSFVGLFLWSADGSFEEVRVSTLKMRSGEAARAESKAIVREMLDGLGDYDLEPITVAPFIEEIDGVRFGWRVIEFDGVVSVNIEPGDFIAYYEPWDGLGYDT